MKSNQKKTKRISRRAFVRGAGAGSAALAGASALSASPAQAQERDSSAIPEQWDLEADFVVIGSGAAGLPAAIRAANRGVSVIVVDANYDAGGHALLSGGNVALGGGTSLQKKYGIEDSPDLLFQDLTDWSVVESNGMPDYRYNDRGVQRALADNEALTFEFLVANGVVFADKAPDTQGGHAIGISAPRENHTIRDKKPSLESPSGSGGTNLMRPLEASARKKGVRFLLNYHMDVILRETPISGRVLGIKASYTPTLLPGTTTPLRSFRSQGNIDMDVETVTVKARKAIMIATGGGTGNVEFRRMFDPRLTEEIQYGGAPFSPQDASGELAGMAIGASLWGTANQTFERNGFVRKRNLIGAQYLYVTWRPGSPIFPLARATGLVLGDWQNVICVNQVGRRFYNEQVGNWPRGSVHKSLDPYKPADWRNARRIEYDPPNFIDAALAINEGSTAPDYSPGPTWAVFDAEAVRRQEWDIEPPVTDPLYFFGADTLSELALKLSKNPYQKVQMPPHNLEATVERYNSIVEFGHDVDFERPSPKYRIDTPPFYAAWAGPVVHDSYAGLRINMKCQVIDIRGQVIPGLYCGGESAGGCSQHGTGRCTTQSYIAGKHAAAEPSWG
ncbi:MAG: FAD-dependent oxidoreductase [Acidobacteriota bacterium]|nr:FAD-dependent oxidoreductase [Acidobacteriota bacterium]